MGIGAVGEASLNDAAERIGDSERAVVEANRSGGFEIDAERKNCVSGDLGKAW